MAFKASASAEFSATIDPAPGGGTSRADGVPPAVENIPENQLKPLHVFRFEVTFKHKGSDATLCSGAFSDCTGLEATVEPKVIKSGGANYGPAQRAGQVSFATVVLKRGMTKTRDLWKWFQAVSGGGYAYRLSAQIAMRDLSGNTVLTWGLDDCIPVKFKSADLNARGSEVGIEELHLAHEGLRLI